MPAEPLPAHSSKALTWNYIGSYVLKEGDGFATMVVQIVRLRWWHRIVGRAIAGYALWRIVRHG
jgi:hypothetical protein